MMPKTMLYSFTEYIEARKDDYEGVDKTFDVLKSELTKIQATTTFPDGVSIDWDGQVDRDRLHDEEEE